MRLCKQGVRSLSPRLDLILAQHHAVELRLVEAGTDIGGESISPATLDALKYALSKGTFISMSMGNSFDDGNPTNYPSAYAPQLNGGISVAAVGSTLSHAYNSGAGSYCEITPPGGDRRRYSYACCSPFASQASP